MSTRVVITGMGVVAPNGNGLQDFELALRKGRSGIRSDESMAGAGFASRVSGVPQGIDEIAASTFDEDILRAMNVSHRYAAIAALDAWHDAGLQVPEAGDDAVDWDSGAILGTGIGGMDTIAERVVPLTDAGRVRRLGSTAVEQVMASGISARVSGLLHWATRSRRTRARAARVRRRCSWAPSASARATRDACCAGAPKARATTYGRASTPCGSCAARATTARSAPRVP